MDKKFDVAAVAEVSNNTYIDRLKRTKKTRGFSSN